MTGGQAALHIKIAVWNGGMSGVLDRVEVISTWTRGMVYGRCEEVIAWDEVVRWSSGGVEWYNKAVDSGCGGVVCSLWSGDGWDRCGL
jgi:hypothetical protein